jgi:ubiquinone/menaquinone biosynthesis C-methylase UbiE
MTEETMTCEAQPSDACQESAWGSQFGHPRGWRGRLVGRLMARKNASMSRLAVELLDVRPSDRVLEIGFGPGEGLRAAVRRAARGRVAGLDRSELMVRLAARRNRAAVARGVVDLRQGDVARLPWPDGTFDRAFEVNSLHHWDGPEAGLRELFRVLREGGRLLLCLRMKHPTRSFLVAPGYTLGQVEEVVDRVRRAGFRDVGTRAGKAGRDVTCVLADR